MRALYDYFREQMAISPEVKHMLETVFKLLSLSEEAADGLLRARERSVADGADGEDDSVADSELADVQKQLVDILQGEPVLTSAGTKRDHSPDSDAIDLDPKKPKPSQLTPLVGDWKCRLCDHWNTRFHQSCRGPSTDTSIEQKCLGTRPPMTYDIRQRYSWRAQSGEYIWMAQQ